MSLLASVKRGRNIRPVHILIYGLGGIGKSTRAASAPNPVFIGSEEGTDMLDVSRFPTPETFDDILKALSELRFGEHNYKTLVIDSLDWVEPLIFKKICERYNKHSIELCAGGYGKGYGEALSEWITLMRCCNELRDKRGMNIIYIAHPEVKNTTNPQTQVTYQRYELKLQKLAKAKFFEAVDAVFFASFEMYTHKDGDTLKIMASPNRVLQGVPNEHDGYDAKNRYGLTAPVPLNLPWQDFMALCGLVSTKELDAIRLEVNALFSSVPADKQKIVRESIEKGWESLEYLVKVKEKMIALTTPKTEEVPA